MMFSNARQRLVGLTVSPAAHTRVRNEQASYQNASCPTPEKLASIAAFTREFEKRSTLTVLLRGSAAVRPPTAG
jgi:hypothetical protein